MLLSPALMLLSPASRSKFLSLDARFRDFRITILELNPQTESGRRIDVSEYEARVKLSLE